MVMVIVSAGLFVQALTPYGCWTGGGEEVMVMAGSRVRVGEGVRFGVKGEGVKG